MVLRDSGQNVILSDGGNHFTPAVTHFQPRWPDCVMLKGFIHALLDGFYNMVNALYTAVFISNIWK